MTHQIIEVLIIVAYFCALVWCWWNAHTVMKHLAVVVIFFALFMLWQYHAYVIGWLHLSPQPLIQDELLDAHELHHH